MKRIQKVVPVYSQITVVVLHTYVMRFLLIRLVAFAKINLHHCLFFFFTKKYFAVLIVLSPFAKLYNITSFL